MGTPSRIIVCVENATSLTFQQKLVYCDVERSLTFEELEQQDQTKPAQFYTPVILPKREVPTNGKKFASIYIHYDGYKEGVGNILKRHFNTLETAQNLITLGNCKSIIQHIVPYSADIEYEEDEEPIFFDSLDEMPKDANYYYLFQNGKWVYCSWRDSIWKSFSKNKCKKRAK